METLILTTTDADGNEAEQEIEIESTGAAERIQCAYFAISAIEGIDTGLMTKQAGKRIKMILAKSVDIIEDAINEIWNEQFEPGSEEDLTI